MNRAFFLNSGLHFEPSSHSPWKPMIPTADGFFQRKWEKSGQYSEFESTLSSMAVSTVSSSIISNDIAAVSELAGKLAGEFSPAAITAPPNPPLISSLSELNLPIINHFVEENLPGTQNSMSVSPSIQFFTDDPGFAERAAKFSCFGRWSFSDRSNQLGLNSSKQEIPVGSCVAPVSCTGKVHRVSSSPVLKTDRPRDSDETNMNLSRLSCSDENSNEESSVSEQIPIGEFGFKNRKVSNSKKRKGSSSKGVGSNTEKKEEDDIVELKRLKKTEHENGGKMEDKSKPVDPPKDYIHVRARRGQATDSHSLAERVRREKISERMKLLQNLVPNCNKVTGKALMLDEIINYVQSLQRQVEFLSMKLATVNPSLDFDTNDQTSQYVNQPNGNLSYHTSTLYQQNPQLVFDGSDPMTQPVNVFAEPFQHGFGQDDLESIVRMGFGDNLDLDTSIFNTIHDPPSMKVELSPQLSTIHAKEREIKYD